MSTYDVPASAPAIDAASLGSLAPFSFWRRQ